MECKHCKKPLVKMYDNYGELFVHTTHEDFMNCEDID